MSSNVDENNNKLIHFCDILMEKMVYFLTYNDVIDLELTCKNLKTYVNEYKDIMFEKYKRNKEWKQFEIENIKIGMRNVNKNIIDDGFKNGVLNGFMDECNKSFINAQWIGHHLSTKIINKMIKNKKLQNN
mmetsp:Transcript_35182/g.43456  ORF Transcript_35182/g.43456 Transcript_35182/m.43456 type:complete len:131 (+) Transcript_35182:569-961(+)